MIRGYADPQLHFYFTPLTMDCYFKYTYKHRDPESPLLESYFMDFFLNGLYLDRHIFEKRFEAHNDFVLPGKLIGSHHDGNSEFQCRVIEDQREPEFSYYNKQIQIFLMFFIETGSYVEANDPMWKFVYMVEMVDSGLSQTPTQRNFVGFVSYYPFYRELDQFRVRISQQIVLPNYQRRGLGLVMLNVVFEPHIACLQALLA